MKIIIPMAGKGTRLRPHTHSKPKPLLHVAGKTMLAHIIDCFKDVEFSEIIFITNNQKAIVEEFVKENYPFKARFIEQKVADGTAGAILLAKEFVDEDVIILYVDTLFDADLSVIKKTLTDKTVDGLIWAKDVEEYWNFGVIVTDNEGYITKLVEKPKEPVSKLAVIGMYYIKDYKLLYEGIDHIYKNNIKQNNEFFLTHALQYMIDNGAKIRPAPVIGWYDCGMFGQLLETNAILLKRHHALLSECKDSTIIQPSFVDKDVIIENSVIGPNVSVARGVTIKDSVIRNSIIDENAVLENVMLIDSTIGSNAKIKSKFKKLHVGDSSQLDGF